MRPHAQALLDVLPASAALLRREARGHSHHHMTGSFSLIREDVEKRAPTRVVNALGEMLVAHHPCHVQVFDTDVAVPLRVLFGRLEMKIASLASRSSDAFWRPRAWPCGGDGCPL